MKVYISIYLIILPVFLLCRNLRYSYMISINIKDGKLLNLPKTFYRVLYPGKKYQTINLFGFIYYCIIVLPSIILVIITSYLAFIQLGVLQWSLHINGYYAVNAAIIIFIYIGIIDIIFEGVLKVIKERSGLV